VRLGYGAAVAEIASDHRRAVSERNEEAILEAGLRLLGRTGQISIVHVAAEAAVSRPTVYAHFPSRERLLEAVIARVLGRTEHIVAEARLDEGPPDEALERFVRGSWETLEAHLALARIVLSELPPEVRREHHEPVLGAMRRLVARGQANGTFRTDVPEEWLVATYNALIHQAAIEVLEGRLDPADGADAVSATLRDAFRGPRAARRPAPR
jgi:TetR/AcrR family transcriptional regulator, mexCD-oprJ operon repressor